jgi:hypothetical protein
LRPRPPSFPRASANCENGVDGSEPLPDPEAEVAGRGPRGRRPPAHPGAAGGDGVAAHGAGLDVQGRTLG